MGDPLSEDVPLRSLHFSVSSRKGISRGYPPYSSLDTVSSWGLDLPKFPQANLEPLQLSPDLKAKKSHFSFQSGLATIPIGQ
jgi:hypothetical protein